MSKSGSSSEDETGSGSSPTPTAAFVSIKLDENLKSNLVRDLVSICEVGEGEARNMLETHNWNMQVICNS